MNVSALVPLLLPVVAVPLANRLAEHLPPRTAAWVLAGTATVLAAATTISLTLITAGGLLRVPYVAVLGHFSRQLSPGIPYSPVAAALALVATILLAARTAHHQRTDLRRARVAVSAVPSGPLAVLQDDRADAFALPGRPSRVVATTGMLGALTAPERAALIAHEQAHLHGGHHLFLALAEYAAVCHPALRPLRSALGFHLERWADEDAARAVGDRALTARAVGRAALAAARTPRPHRPRLAPAVHTGPVPRRVAALLSPHTHRAGAGRTAAALALAACLALTASATLDATTDLHHTVEHAQGELR